MEYMIYSNGGFCIFFGPSTATKPTTGITTGVWVESDTGDAFFYDVATGWKVQ